ILRGYHGLARLSKRKRIAFSEGPHPRVIKAAAMALEEGICEPVLLGARSDIEEALEQHRLSSSDFEIIEPKCDQRFEQMVREFYQIQARRGVTENDAYRMMHNEQYYACMLLRGGFVDGVIAGVDQYFPLRVRPVFRIVGLRSGVSVAAGLYLVSIKDRLFFFADTAINVEMDEHKLAEIACMTADFARSMDIEPRVALLSFSNFGSVRHPAAQLVERAVHRIQERAPGLVVDGEMQADTAIVDSILQENYPFSTLKESANVLIFPDMQSANISYKLLQRLGDARVVGPIILGLKAPAYVLQRHASVDEIFNMTTVAVAQAALRNGA
ncbi:MAG: hypothetical protein KDD44_15140, partial [Bdellovibrionales bacterium]|nr:hypothetical protein [Bdellovibrionales bacterium]